MLHEEPLGIRRWCHANAGGHLWLPRGRDPVFSPFAALRRCIDYHTICFFQEFQLRTAIRCVQFYTLQLAFGRDKGVTAADITHVNQIGHQGEHFPRHFRCLLVGGPVESQTVRREAVSQIRVQHTRERCFRPKGSDLCVLRIYHYTAAAGLSIPLIGENVQACRHLWPAGENKHSARR